MQAKRNNNFLKVWLVAQALLLSTSSKAEQGKDPRFMPITKNELQNLIRQTPISSDKHAVLTSRADTANMEKIAYEEYTKIWQKSPNNAESNLRRGIAALNYWRSIAFVTKRLDKKEQQDKIELFGTIQSSLAKAVKLDPKSVSANVAYGFFIWQYDNQMEKGLKILQETAQKAPNNPKVHANLGAVYSNRSGNAYNIKRAEQQLRTAIQLDRSWAYPYWLIIPVYIEKRDYKNAQWAFNAYSKLGDANDVAAYKDVISLGLRKQG